MSVVGGHHVSFTVSDLEESRRFYEGVLGFEQIERPDFGFPGVWYGVGPIEVHLIAAPLGVDTGTPPAKLTPIANHVAFQIDDYAAMTEHLDANGIEYIGLGEKVGQLFLRDRDGNVIELIQPGGQLGRVPAPDGP